MFVTAQDFDGSEIGSTVSQYLVATHDKESISWRAQPADLFPNGPADVAYAVTEEHCWVAVVSQLIHLSVLCFSFMLTQNFPTVNPGATSMLSQAVASANSSYNGALAITVFSNEARNENA